MIKINLLPRKKRENKGVHLDLYIFLAVLVVSFAAVGGIFFRNGADIARTRDEIGSLKQQAKALESIRIEFLTIEKDKKDTTDKLTVIARMKEGRALPPRILYDLSSLAKDNLWLKRLRKDDKKLEIEGRSIDNESVSDFVERLSKLPYVKDLELRSVEDISEGGITIKKFIVDGSVSL